jgi:hypothetical protein
MVIRPVKDECVIEKEGNIRKREKENSTDLKSDVFVEFVILESFKCFFG